MVFNNYDSGGGANDYWSAQLKNRLSALSKSRTPAALASGVPNSAPARGPGYGVEYTPQQSAMVSLSSALQNRNDRPSGSPTHEGGGSGTIGPGGSGAINSSPSGTAANIRSLAAAQDKAAGGAIPTTNPNPQNYSAQGGSIGVKGNSGWYGDQIQASLPNLQKDQDMQAYVYGQKNGLSDFMIQNLQGYADPYAQFLLQNSATGASGGTNTGILDYSGGFYDYATQSASSNNQNQFNPSQIMQTVLSATGKSDTTKTDGTGAKATTLGAALYGNPDPGTQVNAVKEYVTTALRGIMSDEQLGAYLKTIDQQGMAFSAYKNTMGSEKDNQNFGQWMQARLGPSGGI